MQGRAEEASVKSEDTVGLWHEHVGVNCIGLRRFGAAWRRAQRPRHAMAVRLYDSLGPGFMGGSFRSRDQGMGLDLLVSDRNVPGVCVFQALGVTSMD